MLGSSCPLSIPESPPIYAHMKRLAGNVRIRENFGGN
jgi:hypothetical protein